MTSHNPRETAIDAGNRFYPLRSRGFVRAYLVTMRPYLLFASGAAGLVGLAFAPGLSAARALAAFVPLFLSYGFGQALTDCFQTDTDGISARYRPLVQGAVSKVQVFRVSLAGLLLLALTLTCLDPLILAPGLASVIGLLTYTRLKRTWWGGPPWNAWIVALLPVMGRMAAPGSAVDRLDGALAGLSGALASPPGGDPAARAFVCAVLAVFFGYVNFVVVGYFKDISADRATGYRTFPVVFGWRAAAIYGDVAAALTAGLTALVISARVSMPAGSNPAALLLFGAALVVQLRAQVRIHRTRDEHRTGGAIADSLRGFVLFGLAMTAALRPGWTPWLAVFYALFELSLRLRPEPAQV